MKKKWLLPVIIVAILLLLIGAAGFYMSFQCLSFSSGRCIVASNGSYMILLGNSPITMSNCSGNEELFFGLKTGDEIWILHDGIQETYPGGTGVYYCKRLSEGTMEDIPEGIIESLSPMGWIPVDASGKTKEIYTGIVISYDPIYQDAGNFLLKINTQSGFTEKVALTVVQATDIQSIDGIGPGDKLRLECFTGSSGYREVTKLIEYQKISYDNLSLELPAGWAYEIWESSESEAFGIDFWPESATEGKLKLEYYPDGFGVCGTGLKEEEIRLASGLRAFKGTYDERKVWSFISVRDLPGSYVFLTEQVDTWWDAYEEQAMDIVDSLCYSAE